MQFMISQVRLPKDNMVPVQSVQVSEDHVMLPRLRLLAFTTTHLTSSSKTGY
jgi:hypothetical protein